MKNIILALLLVTVGAIYAQTEGSGKYSINLLTVNSKNSDFGTAFYGEDKLVFASPKKGITLVNDVWVDNNQRFLELYVGDILPNGDLENVSLMKGEVNTRYHEADVVFTRDLKTVYFTRNNFYNKNPNI